MSSGEYSTVLGVADAVGGRSFRIQAIEFYESE